MAAAAGWQSPMDSTALARSASTRLLPARRPRSRKAPPQASRVASAASPPWRGLAQPRGPVAVRRLV
eukprot:2041518-Pleurochrysis_carterae.AAC.1